MSCRFLKVQVFVVASTLSIAMLLFAAQRRQTDPGPQFRAIVDLTESSAEPTLLRAPASMGGAWTLETLPAARLVAPLSVIQVQRKNFAGSEQLLTMDDVAEYERLHGPIPQGSVVLAFSAKKDVVPVFDAISLEFLIEARNVIGVGNAGTSVSPPQANSLLATKGVYELLNVANVSELPQTNSVIIAAPQKTPGAAEGPVRLMALLK